jgi:cbb3-type cytochrome oxidase subunit 3
MRLLIEIAMAMLLIGGVFYVNKEMARENRERKQKLQEEMED